MKVRVKRQDIPGVDEILGSPRNQNPSPLIATNPTHPAQDDDGTMATEEREQEEEEEEEGKEEFPDITREEEYLLMLYKKQQKLHIPVVSTTSASSTASLNTSAMKITISLPRSSSQHALASSPSPSAVVSSPKAKSFLPPSSPQATAGSVLVKVGNKVVVSVGGNNNKTKPFVQSPGASPGSSTSSPMDVDESGGVLTSNNKTIRMAPKRPRFAMSNTESSSGLSGDAFDSDGYGYSNTEWNSVAPNQTPLIFELPNLVLEKPNEDEKQGLSGFQRPGNTLVISFTMPEKSNRFCFNLSPNRLYDEKDPNTKIYYHFNPRDGWGKHKEPTIMQNYFENRTWSKSDFPVPRLVIRKGVKSELCLIFRPEGFVIFIDRAFVSEFPMKCGDGQLHPKMPLCFIAPLTESRYGDPENVIVHSAWWGWTQPPAWRDIFSQVHRRSDTGQKFDPLGYEIKGSGNSNSNNNNNNNNNNSSSTGNRRSIPSSVQEPRTLYVSGLSTNENEALEELERIFQHYGVELKNGHSNIKVLSGKGTGFVTLTSEKNTEKAIEYLDNTSIGGGRTLRVARAVKKGYMTTVNRIETGDASICAPHTSTETIVIPGYKENATIYLVLYGLTWVTIVIVNSRFLYYRKQYAHLRKRSLLIVFLNTLSFALQSTGSALWEGHNYPCFMKIILVTIVVPILAMQIPLRLLDFYNKYVLAQAITKISRNTEDVLSNNNDQNARTSAIVYDVGIQTSTKNLAVKEVVASTPKESTIELVQRLKFLSSQKVQVAIFIACMSPYVIFLLVRTFTVPYLIPSNGCRYCVTSIYEQIIIFLGGVVGIIGGCFGAYKLRNVPDPFGIVRENRYTVYCAILTIIGFAIDVAMDPKPYFEGAYVLWGGLLAFQLHVTEFQIFIAKRKEKSLNLAKEEGGLGVPTVVDTTNSRMSNLFSEPKHLKTLLAKQNLIPYFEKHMESEFSSEVLRMYLDCVNFENVYFDITEASRLARAKKLYSLHVDDNAPMQVNLPYTIKISLKQRIEASDISTNLFAESKGQLYQMMQGSFSRFQKSKYYKEMKMEQGGKV